MPTATRWFGLGTMLFALAVAPALANPARGGASATPKVHGPNTTTPAAAPKGTTVKSSTVKTKSPSAGPKTTSKAPAVKPTKSTTPKGNSATAKTKSGATTRTSTKSGTTTTSHTTSGSTTTSSATWTPDPGNAVAVKLSTKSNILKKVMNSLGTTDLNSLNGATAGFKNFGQFVAAINVSNNHHIAFADLKAAMTGMDMFGQPVLASGTTGATSGTTGVPTTMSLGQAIQTLKPGVDAETVAQTALTQADREINSSTTTTSSTSASTSTTTTKAKPKSR